MRFGILGLTFGGVASACFGLSGIDAAAQSNVLPGQAGTLPDLAITDDSVVACAPGGLRACPPTVGASCATNDALWSGFVTVKNVGYSDFTPGAGGGGQTTGNLVLGQATNAAPAAAAASGGAIVQAYVANNANFIDVAPLTQPLRPLEQTRVELSIGTGREKHCDTFGIPPKLGTGTTVVDPFRDSIRGIQRLLNARLPTSQTIVEDGVFGSRTAKAVEAVFNREVLPLPRAYADDIFDARPGINNQTARFLYQTLNPSGATPASTTSALPATSSVTQSCERLARSGAPQRVTIIVEVNPSRAPRELSYVNNRRSFVVELNNCQ